MELKGYEDVFKPGLGKYTGKPAHIELVEGAQPVFLPPRQVPYAKESRANTALDLLVEEESHFPVQNSEWGTPVINVIKHDGGVRVCGDYSETVNPLCKKDVYPMTTVNQILDKLAGGKFFCQIGSRQGLFTDYSG